MKLFSKSLLLSALFLSPTLLGGPLLAQAEDSPAPAPQAPRLGPVQVTEVGGGIGGTEEGFSLSAHAGLEAKDFLGSVELSMGQPILRLRGHAEAIPIRLVSRPIANGQDFELTFVPINSNFQVSLPAAGDSARHYLQISPEVRAQFNLRLPRDLNLKLQAIAAPISFGVAHDGDGTAPILTTRVGAGVELEAPLTSRSSLSVALQGASSPSWLSSLGAGQEFRAGVQYNFWPSEGQQYYVRLEGQSNRFDVRPNAGDANTDSGSSSSGMLSVGMRF